MAGHKLPGRRAGGGTRTAGKAQRTPGPSSDSRRLRLAYIPAGELAENPANWRRHPQTQIDALAAALERVGWAGALLFNERTGRLIDGHARRRVADPATEVPVLIGDWTEDEERTILATLDPLAGMATTDHDALEGLLEAAALDGPLEAVGDVLQRLVDESRPPEDRPPVTAPEPDPRAVGCAFRYVRYKRKGQLGYRVYVGDVRLPLALVRDSGGNWLARYFGALYIDSDGQRQIAQRLDDLRAAGNGE